MHRKEISARQWNRQVKRKEKGGKMQDSGSLSNNPVIQGGGNYLIISIFKKIPLQNHGCKNTIFYSCPCVRAGKVFNKNDVEIVDKR